MTEDGKEGNYFENKGGNFGALEDTFWDSIRKHILKPNISVSVPSLTLGNTKRSLPETLGS